MNSIRPQTAGRSSADDDVEAARTAGARLRRSYVADPGTLALVRADVAALAESHGATPEQVADIRLLVSEAVTNAVRHAYPDGRGTVQATAVAGARHLTILVSDDGVGPHALSRDRGPGWGWPLIAALTDSFTIRRRANGGTEVEMHVSIGPGPPTGRSAAARI